MKISAIIPCYNEEITIKQVIEDIRKYCNECEIYVFKPFYRTKYKIFRNI